MGRSDSMSRLPEFISKMKNEGLGQLVIDTFAYYYEQVVRGETGYVRECDIRAIRPDEVDDDEQLGSYSDAGKKALPHAAMRQPSWSGHRAVGAKSLRNTSSSHAGQRVVASPPVPGSISAVTTPAGRWKSE